MERKLYEAAIHGNVDTLVEIMNEDPVILFNATTKNPLAIAAILGHVEFARKLLSYSKDLTSESDEKGLTPLHLASQQHSVEMVELLIDANPRVCLLTDAWGIPPLHLAAMKDREEIVKILIQAEGEAMNIISEFQQETIFHICVKHNSFNSLKILVDLMNKDEIHLDYKDPANKTVSFTSKDGQGNTLLHVATAKKNLKMVNYLLNNQLVEKDAVNANGYSAMNILLKADHKDIFDLELQHVLQKAAVVQENAEQHIEQKDHSTASARMKSDNSDQDYGKWLKENKNTLMVVASVIGSVAFAAGQGPPGGVWSESKKYYSNGAIINLDPNVSREMDHKDPHFRGYLLADIWVFFFEVDVLLFMFSVHVLVLFMFSVHGFESDPLFYDSVQRLLANTGKILLLGTTRSLNIAVYFYIYFVNTCSLFDRGKCVVISSYSYSKLCI